MNFLFLHKYNKFLLETLNNHNFKILNECTSVGTSVAGKVILAKNRDRTYIPRISIVREIINGIETVYMHDEETDYSEGMNEFGIGIVNTTLQGKKDENEGVSMDKKHRNKKTKISKDGFKIRKALGYSNIEKVIKCLDLYQRGIGGHTTVGCKDYFVSIEKLKFGKPSIKKFGKDEIIVRTNHGIQYPDQGYQTGKDRKSSMSRYRLATKEARKSETPEELLASLRKHHDGIPGYLEPYRTNYKVWTSSQIMLNLTDLVLTFIVDENTEFLGIENKLPKDYVPKIKINIEKLELKLITKPVNQYKYLYMNKEKFVLHSFNKYCDNLLNEGLLPKSLADRIFRNIDPRNEFPKSINEFINLILRVTKDKYFDDIENDDYLEDDFKVDYDAWYYFLTGDKEVLERSFFKITNPNHLPKISKNKNSIYYDILPEKKEYNLAEFYIMSEENTKILVDVAKKIRKPATSSQISDLCGFPSHRLESTFMGSYTISYGKDDEGEYISYYDIWDFTSSKLPILGNIMDFVGYPFEIYGRIYFDVIDEKRARFRPAIQTF